MNALRWRRTIGAGIAADPGVAHAPRARLGAPQNRRLSLASALAVLVLLLAAGIAVLLREAPRPSEPPPIPAEVIPNPELQPEISFDFVPQMWGMADATTWHYLNFNLFQLDAGKSFSTDLEWYTIVDGPILIMVEQGELSIQPSGPALFYSAEDRDQAPREIAAGQTISLGPYDGIVYAAKQPASGSNIGSEPAVALLGDMGHLSSESDAGPIDIRNLDSQSDYGMDPLQTASASISIQHLRLAPYDSFVFEPGANWTYLSAFDQFRMAGAQMADGAVDGLSPDVDTHWLYNSVQLTYPSPGPHTIFNLGDEPFDIFFLVVEPSPAQAATT